MSKETYVTYRTDHTLKGDEKWPTKRDLHVKVTHQKRPTKVTHQKTPTCMHTWHCLTDYTLQRDLHVCKSDQSQETNMYANVTYQPDHTLQRDIPICKNDRSKEIYIYSKVTLSQTTHSKETYIYAKVTNQKRPTCMQKWPIKRDLHVCKSDTVTDNLLQRDLHICKSDITLHTQTIDYTLHRLHTTQSHRPQTT